MIRSPRLAGLVVLLLSFAGCDCGRRGTSGKAPAELGVVWKDNGVEVINREATYEFGAALMGERVGKKLVLRNLGRGALTLVSIEPLEGDPVTVGEQVAPNAAFDIRFVPGQALGAAEEVELDMFFTPPHSLDPTVRELDHYAKLTLRSEGPPDGEETATIILKGHAAAGTCYLPEALDFGKVPVGERFVLQLEIRNLTPVATVATIGAPSSANGDHLAFPFAPGSAAGDLQVPAQGTNLVTLEFAPTEYRPYAATMKARASTACPEGEIQLLGEGTDEVLTWEPSSIDYGYVSTGTEAIKAVTFTNLSKVPIVLRGIATDGLNFEALSPSGGDPTQLTIPGGGVPTQLPVSCHPQSLGPHSSTLSFLTGLTKQPFGTVALSCYGGGPNITVVPRPTLAFGKVGYFPNANPAPEVVRKVTVINSGTRPPDENPNGNLRLGSVDASGPGQLPFISVQPANAGTAPGEFSASIASSYDPAVGLIAQPGKNMVDLVVTLVPQSIGTKEADLTIYTNDPDEPEVTIRLVADAQELPPCNYAISPTQLNFGLVTPPTYKDLGVTIVNLGQNAGDICYLSGLEIAAGSDPAYMLVGGPLASLELQPGQAYQATVRVWPQGAVPNGMFNLSGIFQFNVPSTTNPVAQVNLSAVIGPACITITPDNLDFATVMKGCSSSTRTFNVYNICTSPVSITSFSVPMPAGQAAGGPDCPGSAPCPEFQLVSTPAIPGSGLTLNPGAAPVTFQAKYRPIDFGADSGAIAVNVTQSGQNVTYLVSLTGNGDGNGQQTDAFVQDAKPKADLLLTIDDSCSMEDKQKSLANNFSSFIQYAQAANVDYQIGVTTTDDEGEVWFQGTKIKEDGARGKLLGTATNPTVLTPNTPDLVAKFQQKVKVGSNGSGAEKGLACSLKALTPPLIANENAGFLRPEANLAIVVVTDALDQSPEPVSYYVNRMLNIKGFNKANMFTFNVIGPKASSAPSGCTYDESAPDDGRYGAATVQTTGIFDEVCDPNWSTKLESLGKTAFGFRTHFFLNSTPDLTGGKVLTVTVNGAPATGWTYDPVTNAVKFDPTTTPGPGETLTVSYTVACF